MLEGIHGSGSIPAAGDLLLGKYRVERLLGRGGMGVVLAARHLELDEIVAIKLVLPNHAAGEEIVARFVREARAAAKIRGEHVARVTDVGRLENGVPYMVMELLDGEDLEKCVERAGPLSVAHAVDCVLQACEALAEAHGLGIVHRDLKPSILFLTTRVDGTPCVKVLDFGISKLTTGDQAMTTTQQMLGSPLFMSPEQLNSARDVDIRTDVWSLGVIFYQLLTGVYPFVAETMPQLIAKIVLEPPAPVRQHRPEVDPGLERVIMHCLEKQRAARIPDVATLAAALAPFASETGRSSVRRIFAIVERTTGSHRAVPVVTPHAPVAESVTNSPWVETGAPRRTSSMAWIALPVAALIIAAVVVGAIMLGRGAKTAESASNAVAAPFVSSAKAEVTAPPPAVSPNASAEAVAVAASSATAATKATATPKQTVAPKPKPSIKKPADSDPFGGAR